MPKMKTKSGAKKRFTVTGTGKIKRRRAFHRHILTKKSMNRKRTLRDGTLVHESDSDNVRLMIPYL
jgi:large subunit ribosomal protein L35